jgi:hypothetical protein
MTLRMPRWYERANEASFKPVKGGYVFQAPSPWIIARPSYYLVNDAKKAEIFTRLGRWRLLLLLPVPVICFLMLPVILLPSTFGRLLLPVYLQLGTGLFSSLLFIVLMLLMAPFIAMPQIYLARALRPLLADAPLTDERIKLGEQLPKIAGAVSTRLLVVGLISGFGMMLAGGLPVLDAFLEGHLAGGALFSSSIFEVVGGLLTFYFIHLLRLKTKARRAAP